MKRCPSGKVRKGSKCVETGQFISGTKWKKYLKVTHDGKTFDTKTTYVWENPDFPEQKDIDIAIRTAKRAGEKNPDEAFESYINWRKQEYKFKCSGFLKYGREIDCLPKNSPLGRISVKDLIVVNRRR